MSWEELAIVTLPSIRRQAEKTVHDIERISKIVTEMRKNLQELVTDYSAKRVELFKQKLQENGMTWCTYCCDTIAKNSEFKLLLIEGKEEYSHGYGDAYYGFRSFSKLHKACFSCSEIATDKHGQKGEYDTQANDQSYFYAFLVEKRGGSYYARKFGSWVKLDEKYQLGEISSEQIEKFAKDWNLPPKIEIESTGPTSLEEVLVIHEEHEVTEAS